MNGGEPLPLEVRDLVVRYGETVAVAGVTLGVRPHTVLALVGASGCGKTSLLRAMAGFERPASGEVFVASERVAGGGEFVPPERRHIGMVFQQCALFPHMTVRANVRFGVEGRRDADRLTDIALERVGLTSLARRYPDQLSGGQQQLAALARALAPSPRVVLLDEPFASLDAGLRSRLRDDVRDVLTNARMTAVLVTHDQDEALALADEVAVMSAGRLIQLGSPSEVYHRPASAEVAEFIGGGQLVPVRVAGGLLRGPLGPMVTDAPDGGARLLVRPEQLRIDASDQAGAAGRIERRQFFGHDRLDEIRLEGGTRVLARALGGAEPEVGTRVAVSLPAASYRVFADAGGAVHVATPAVSRPGKP